MLPDAQTQKKKLFAFPFVGHQKRKVNRIELLASGELDFLRSFDGWMGPTRQPLR